MKPDKEIFYNAKQLHQSGKIKEAQKLYLKIIDNNKNNFQLFFLLGTSFLQIKEYNKAINYLDNAINLNSNFADAFNNKGKDAKGKGKGKDKNGEAIKRDRDDADLDNNENENNEEK